MVRKILIAAGALLMLAAAFFAGRETLREPPAVDPVPEQAMTVTVATKKVERTITLTTTVERQTRPVATNRLAGVITAVNVNNKVELGTALYAVAGQPVVAFVGSVPLYRDLGPDAKGADVREVQENLTKLGYSVKTTGTWGDATTAALKRWQKSQGFPVTGTLPLGQAIVFPQLPSQVVTDPDKLWVGGELSGGEILVRGYSGEPSFAMTLTKSQLDQVPTGTPVRITSGDLTWEGITGEAQERDGNVAVPVTAPDGGLPCAHECNKLPVQEKISLLTDVLIVPSATGPVVPVSALRTTPEGTTTVTVVEAGTDVERPVTVRQVADGLAVVDGVADGQTVKVFGQS